MSKTVVFLHEPDPIAYKDGETILEAALKNNINLDHECDGMGTCGTCRVFVRSGLEQLGKRNSIESEKAETLDYKPHERLACQNKCVEGLELELPNKISQDTNS